MRNSILVLACLLVVTQLRAAGETQGLASADRAVRQTAIEKLRAAGEEAVPVLEDGIASDETLVVLACLDLAAEGGFRRTRNAVRAVAGDGTAPALVRRAAIRALGRVGDYRDVSFLSGLLATWPEAALALARLRDEDAVPALRDRFEKGTRTPELAFALASFGEEDGLSALVTMVGGPHGPAALRFLRRHSGTDAGTTREAWKNWYRLDRLAARLGDEDWAKSDAFLSSLLTTVEPALAAERVADLISIATDGKRGRNARTKAILGLGRLGAAESAPCVLRLLFTDPDGLVRVYAAEALGRIGVMDTAVDLVWYLVNDEEEFRKITAKHRTDPYFTIDSAVAKALLRLGALGGLDRMIDQLGEEHRVRVHHQAVKALRRATGQDFGYEPDARRVDRQAVAARWRRWFDEHRDTIARPDSKGLGDSEFRRRVRELVDGLGNFHFLEMSRARQKLTLLGELVVSELVLGLDRPDVHIRTHCAEVLGWIRAREARSALASALEDPRIEVRAAAARALAMMGPGAATGQLLVVLGDKTTDGLDARIEAARALARASKEQAVPALISALARKENDSDTFRLEAWFALAAHGDAEYLDELIALMETRSEVAFRQVVSSRLAALTGRSPGVTDESIAGWRQWWQASRLQYTPASPYGERR